MLDFSRLRLHLFQLFTQLRFFDLAILDSALHLMVGNAGRSRFRFGLYLGLFSAYCLRLPQFQQPGIRTGNPNYMAPEIVRRRPTDQKVDVFAYGVSCYEICTGELPWPRFMPPALSIAT